MLSAGQHSRWAESVTKSTCVKWLHLEGRKGSNFEDEK
jgi:hypothetical protein